MFRPQWFVASWRTWRGWLSSLKTSDANCALTVGLAAGVRSARLAGGTVCRRGAGLGTQAADRHDDGRCTDCTDSHTVETIAEASHADANHPVCAPSPQLLAAVQNSCNHIRN
jgi:hypothetical protein